MSILARAAHWLEWHRDFGPASGAEPKLADAFFRYVLVVFCQATGMGPTQAARLIQDVSAHELSAIYRRHVNTAKLARGDADMINAFMELDLRHPWGDGTSVAVDGTQIDTLPGLPRGRPGDPHHPAPALPVRRSGTLAFREWRAQAASPIAYPADPKDTAPAITGDPSAVDAALPTPGCPGSPAAVAAPDPRAAGRMVEWGAVRIVRCSYLPRPPADGPALETVAAFDRAGQAQPLVSTLRRTITPDQSKDSFGAPDNVSNLLPFGQNLYLVQYGDGRVIAVVHDEAGYHQEAMLRLPYSRRGADMGARDQPGGRGCSPTTTGMYRSYRKCALVEGSYLPA